RLRWRTSTPRWTPSACSWPTRWSSLPRSSSSAHRWPGRRGCRRRCCAAWSPAWPHSAGDAVATLTIPQIAQLAVNVGVPNGAPLYTAVAIALAESSGRTDAVNTANDNGTTDRGLWQINSVHDDKMPGADRFDPEVNARLMGEISAQGTNWYPWSTYNNGSYLEHLARVTT